MLLEALSLNDTVNAVKVHYLASFLFLYYSILIYTREVVRIQAGQCENLTRKQQEKEP